MTIEEPDHLARVDDSNTRRAHALPNLKPVSLKRTRSIASYLWPTDPILGSKGLARIDGEHQRRNLQLSSNF